MENQKYEKEVAVSIAIQKEGQATIEEIKAKTDEWGFKLQLRSIKSIVEKLRKRNLVSLNYVDGADGLKQEAYSQTNFKWKSIPDNPHITDIVDSPEGKMFINLYDTEKGAKKSKSDWANSALFEVVFEVKDLDGANKILGYWPDETGIHRFYRNSNKKIIFYPKHFRAWFRQNMESANLSFYHLDKFGFHFGMAESNGVGIATMGCGIEIIEAPILAGEKQGGQSQGKGIIKAETLGGGTRIITQFTVPLRQNGKEKTERDIEQMFKNMCIFKKSGFGGWSHFAGIIDVVSVKLLAKIETEESEADK